MTIGNSVTTIGSKVFYDCWGLTSVTIPNSVTFISNEAFAYCSGLTSVTIGNNVTTIGSEAFYGCSGLTSVHIIDLSAWCNIKFLDFYSNPLQFAQHLFIEGNEVFNLNIPNSVTSIGNYSFYGCSSLTSVTIPGSVTSVGDYACSGGSGLTSATIPNSIKSIGQGAFLACSNLSSVTIPNGVTSIGNYAFYECSDLTSVTIGTGIQKIGELVFANCSELTDVFCYAENVPNTNSNAFQDSYIDYATLHVPGASVNLYKSTAPWSGFGTIVGTDGSEPITPVTQKCATPTINYANGKLSFSCETEDVEFVSEIKSADISKFYSKDVSLTGKYTVTVYATKAGYDNSDTATKEINMAGTGGSGVPGDVNSDGVVNAADVVKVTNIIMGE